MMRAVAAEAGVERSDRPLNRLHAPPVAAVWLLPLGYPLLLQGFLVSAELVRKRSAAAVPLFLLALLGSMAGPAIGWLTLNYVDHRQLDRRAHRVAVRGALVCAVGPPLLVLLGTVLARLGLGASRELAWYTVTALVIAAAMSPASEPARPSATLRRVHATAAAGIVAFSLVHVFNHVLALVSLDTHTAVLEVLRAAYRTRVVEGLLVAAVIVQVCTGMTLVWRVHLRRSTAVRNLQTISGLYLLMFFASHLTAVFLNRATVDTTFAWATSGPGGMLAPEGSARLLPYYTLAIGALFVHLGCQAQWNLARSFTATAARRISYAIMAVGAAAAIAVAAAACGLHLH